MTPSGKIRILAFSPDFRPMLGGVATCGSELCSALVAEPGAEVRFLAPAMALAEKWDRQSPFPIHRTHFSSWTVFSVPWVAFALLAEILKFRPRAIVGFLWLPCGLAALLLLPILRLLGIRYYLFGHGVELIESNRSLKKRLRSRIAWLKRWAFRNAARCFAVSQYAQSLMVNHCGVVPEKTTIVHNGVDPSFFTPGPRPQALLKRWNLEGKKIILTLTRLEDYKGVDRTISAMRWISEAIPEAVYLVCGEGPDRPRLEAIARHYRVQERVRFVGRVEPSELCNVYRLADVFALISRDDLETPNVEGFGIVFLEAAACAKACVGGNAGGIPDAIEDGKTGWLVDPWDDAAIAKTLVRALRSPEHCAELGKRGRDRVIADFSWKSAARKTLEEIVKDVRN